MVFGNIIFMCCWVLEKNGEAIPKNGNAIRENGNAISENGNAICENGNAIFGLLQCPKY